MIANDINIPSAEIKYGLDRTYQFLELCNNPQKNISIINSAEATAKYVNKYLLNKSLTTKLKSNNLDEYYVSDKPEQFDNLADMFLGIKNINVKYAPFI